MLSLIKLSSRVYHSARWDGVRQAVQVGATEGEIALGVSTENARDFIWRIHERDRELAQFFQQASS